MNGNRCGGLHYWMKIHCVIVSNCVGTIMLLFSIAWKPPCCCFQLHENNCVVVFKCKETIMLLFPISWKPLYFCFQLYENYCCFRLLENHCVVVSNWMKTIGVACIFVWRSLCVSKKEGKCCTCLHHEMKTNVKWRFPKKTKILGVSFNMNEDWFGWQTWI
jgi:hypothetical protein